MGAYNISVKRKNTINAPTCRYTPLRPPLTIIGFLMIFTMGCMPNSCTDSNHAGNDILNAPTEHRERDTFYVKDPTLYNPAFIKGLKEFAASGVMSFRTIKLIDNFIITGGDTLHLDTKLPLNEFINFYGQGGDNHYELDIRRINYTDIEYRFRINASSKGHGELLTGTAVMRSDIVLATSSVPDDDSTGEAYG